MVIYNPKDWIKLIFQFHKSDTVRMLTPAMIALGIYTGILTYLEIDLKLFSVKSTTVVHSLLGFVISLLLVFRTNTAYERWWEGRKLWGELVNNSRNLAIKINAFVPTEINNSRNRLASLLAHYPTVLKEHLRKGVDELYLESIPAIDVAQLKKYKHKPNGMVNSITQELCELNKQKVVSDEKLLLLNEEVKSLVNVAGACERIKNTPIPYSYSLFIKKIIFAYVFSMPFGFILDFKYWTIPIVIFVFYAFASLELIAEEIEDPFGSDANDLPTDDLAEKIKANVQEIITY
ncbi:MAG: hypothetical protein J0M08_11375 [Bacteroidetes bacterium]|nr:hypothetical protein [Bacteroidota bacterium]